MSDYSFMKTGFNNLVEQTKLSDEEMRNIEAMLALFMSNAMKDAMTYTELSNRNHVTKEDIKYGLRYEVFEFLNTENLVDKVNDMNDELDELEDDEEDYEYMDDVLVSEEELIPFKRIDDVSNIEGDNLEFVEKMNHYYDIWDEWIPDTPLLKILKNSIDKID